MEDKIKEVQENVAEAVEELKENHTLTDILNKQTKFAERDVVTYLNYDSALKAFDLQEEIVALENRIETARNLKHRSITDDSVEELQTAQEEVLAELTALNDEIQSSRAVWSVRGLSPSEWKIIDKTARQRVPVKRDVTEQERVEAEYERNEYVNISTLHKGIREVSFADGTKISEITYEDAQNLWNSIPMEVSLTVKDKIDELTYASRTFHQDIASADFLSSI